jgi:hypothetical protein
VLAALSSFSFAAAEEAGLVPEHTGRALNREFEDKLVWKTALHYACKLFLPAYVRAGIAIVRSVRYLKAGLSALLHGKLSVSVLDATAVTGPPRFRYGRLRDVHARPRRAAGGLDAQKVHRRSGGGHGAERRPRVGARRGRAGAACLREGHPRGRLRRRPYRQHDPARRPRDRRRGHGEPVLSHRRIHAGGQAARQPCLWRYGGRGRRVCGLRGKGVWQRTL